MSRTTKDFMRLVREATKESDWRKPKGDKYFYDVYFYLWQNHIITINDKWDMQNILDNSIVCPCNTEYITKENADNYGLTEKDYQELKNNNIILLHYSNAIKIIECERLIPVGYFKAQKQKEKDFMRFLIVGAKWWDKVNGNTYNSAVIIDNKTNKKYYVPYQYGYGEAWKSEAINYINENIVNYEIDYNNYNAVCVGYIKKADVKNYTYY